MKVIIVFVVLVVALAWAFAPPSAAGLVKWTRRQQLALSASGDDEKNQSIPQIDVVANIARLKAMAAQLKAGERHLLCYRRHVFVKPLFFLLTVLFQLIT